MKKWQITVIFPLILALSISIQAFGEELLLNGDFSRAERADADCPLGWDLPDGLGVIWGEGPKDSKGKNFGRAIRIDTAVSETAIVKQWREKGITQWDIPNAVNAPVARTYGLSFYSKPFEVKPGVPYKVEFDFLSEKEISPKSELAKLWVRGYGVIRGSVKFKERQITSLKKLSIMLVREATSKKDCPGHRLWENFSQQLKDDLTAYATQKKTGNVSETSLTYSLVRALNDALKNKKLYSQEAWSGATFPKETTALLAKLKGGAILASELRRLNRQLIEVAYGGLIDKSDERRRLYETIVNIRPADNNWHHYEQLFHPTRVPTTRGVTELKVMLYAFYPPGAYWFDNVSTTESTKEAYEAQREADRKQLLEK